MECPCSVQDHLLELQGYKAGLVPSGSIDAHRSARTLHCSRQGGCFSGPAFAMLTAGGQQCAVRPSWLAQRKWQPSIFACWTAVSGCLHMHQRQGLKRVILQFSALWSSPLVSPSSRNFNSHSKTNAASLPTTAKLWACSQQAFSAHHNEDSTVGLLPVHSLSADHDELFRGVSTTD